MSRRSRQMLLWAMIPLALAVLIWVTTQKTSVYYWTVKEALAQQPKQPIRISGFVVADSIQYDAKNFLLKFRIEDEKTCEQIEVEYHGMTPDTFKEGIQVVMTGTLDTETRTLKVDDGDMLVKCPSKYQPAAGQAPVDMPPPTQSPCASRQDAGYISP
ncbi:MAG: cytochrome c maturation protein CcmE [bacterium]